jgi:hypothetical protein
METILRMNNFNENIFCNPSATATSDTGQYVVSFNPTIAFNLNLLKQIYFLLWGNNNKKSYNSAHQWKI